MIQFLHFTTHGGGSARDNKEVFLRASKIWIEILTAADLLHLALSLSKDADRLFYLISPSYYTDYSDVYFCFICFTTEFYVGNSSAQIFIIICS